MKQKQITALPLVGQHICVADATNPSLIGITGTVVDETYHTICVSMQPNAQQTTKILDKHQVTVHLHNHAIAGTQFLGTVQRIKQ